MLRACRRKPFFFQSLRHRPSKKCHISDIGCLEDSGVPFSDMTIPQGKTRIIIIGGSGMIGGALVHYFNKRCPQAVEVLSPNSKMLNLKEIADVKRYFQHWRPDFIINAAIAAIDADPQLAYRINYVGCINLAKVALAFKIPYIFISSAAVLPVGENLDEEKRLELSPGLSNYAKSKLMSELTLEHLHKKEGLDYTLIRLAIVYGKHDYKIQGFHRMLFSIADQAMALLFTGKGVRHSYSNAKKLPYFVYHILQNREEFSGQAYHFIDPQPVELAELVLTIKEYLKVTKPRKIFMPLPMARVGLGGLKILQKMLIPLGIETKLPAELIFLDKCYKSQTLSSVKLEASSYKDPWPEETIYRKLPEIINYYISRWEHLNLIEGFSRDSLGPRKQVEDFSNNPETLLRSIHDEEIMPFGEFGDLE